MAGRLRGVGQAYVRFAEQRPRLYELVDAQDGGPGQEEAVARCRRLAEAPLREAYEQGMSGPQSERLAHVPWAATHGLISLERAGQLRHGVSAAQLLQDLCDTFAFGVAPRDQGAS